MKKVFVSGCFDILHAGHVQFFKDAKALGDHLTVCFASEAVLEIAKHRKPTIPDDNKMEILGSLSCVDEVVTSSDLDPIFDFRSHIKKSKPDILAVTEDDKNIGIKKTFCKENGLELVVLKKRSSATQVSTTSILTSIKNIEEVPLRVDFAGGWLDVPSLSKKGGYIVNCSISPKVSLANWPYEQNSGLGGSAAYALLQSKSGIKSEISLGVGWQDPAVISETGLCVWRSGKEPILDIKINPEFLSGKMLIVWTGKMHKTFNLTKLPRDYNLIKQAGIIARDAVQKQNLKLLAKAINTSYKVQLKEGMDKLPNIKNSIAKKYLGGGHGGYALYLFPSKIMRNRAHKQTKGSKIIEPFIKNPV